MGGASCLNIKKWKIAELNKENAAEIAQKYSLPHFLAMLLDIRGIKTEEQIKDALFSGATLGNPFEMKDMDKAVERIRQAMDNQEKIAIYGDYDADGITSTAILYSYLDAMGCDVMYYIPQREGEGYGMNIGAVEFLHSKGVQLIITVDNGIASVEEVKRATELGVDVVITDHHRAHEVLPEAVAVVDAHRPDCPSKFKELCGAGVVLKLLIALEDGDEDMIMSEYADLAAIGTIADVVPLRGDNRLIVRTGLEFIAQGGKPGLDALVKESVSSGKEITAKGLSFTVIPRINATGRMRSPDIAVKLLTTSDEEEAAEIAQEICAENEDRKAVEAKILEEVKEKIRKDPEQLYQRVLVIDGENWHHGVIGIVASRVTNAFGKPCIIISTTDREAKGSGRSVDGFSLFDAISYCKDLMDKYGGHPMAAGINLKSENVPELRRKINEYARMNFPEMPAQIVELDCRLNPAAVSTAMPEDASLLEPFGSDNPEPLVGLYGMEIDSVVPVGGGNHLRISCVKNGKALSCMKFGTTLQDFPYRKGDVVDLAASLETREYKDSLQLTTNIKAMKLSGIDMNECIHTYRLYECIKRKEKMTRAQAVEITPTRQEIGHVYRFIVHNSGSSMGVQSILGKLKDKGINLGKLLLSFDVLNERQLTSCVIKEEVVSLSMHKTTGEKINIYDSAVFKDIKELINT